MSKLYALSDRLQELNRRLAEGVHAGFYLAPEDVADLRATVTRCTDDAKRLETEISRHRWNEQSRNDPVANALGIELERVGTNVVSLPKAGDRR